MRPVYGNQEVQERAEHYVIHESGIIHTKSINKKKQTDEQKERQTNSGTDGQTDRQTKRQRDKNIDSTHEVTSETYI